MCWFDFEIFLYGLELVCVKKLVHKHLDAIAGELRPQIDLNYNLFTFGES